MLKVEELFALATYTEDGSIVTTGQQLVPIFHTYRELEPLGEVTMEWLRLNMLKKDQDHYYNIIQKGLILVEGYDLKRD